jgi:ferrous iron transport protein A
LEITFNKATLLGVSARASVPPLDWAVIPDSIASPHADLAALELGRAAKVIAVALEEELSRWLAAIGVGRGDRVTVLRRAPFGGPIHVRTHTGGEIAIDRALARAIHVERACVERAGETKGAA